MKIFKDWSMTDRILIEYWSNTGQYTGQILVNILVKYRSIKTDQDRRPSNWAEYPPANRSMVKYWSNTGVILVENAGQTHTAIEWLNDQKVLGFSTLVKHCSNTGRILVGYWSILVKY
jgi:hypothetical protein